MQIYGDPYRLSHYLTTILQSLVNRFILNGSFSAECHNANTTANATAIRMNINSQAKITTTMMTKKMKNKSIIKKRKGKLSDISYLTLKSFSVQVVLPWQSAAYDFLHLLLSLFGLNRFRFLEHFSNNKQSIR